MQRTTIGIAAALALATASSSLGVGLSAGNALATINDSGVVWALSGGSDDVVFDSFWSVRSGVGTTASVLSATSFTSAGDTATFTGTLGSLSFVMTYVLSDLDGSGTTAARLDATLQLTNTGSSVLDLDVFSYTDFDLDGSIFDNSSTFDDATGVFQVSGSEQNAEFGALGYDAYEADEFDTLADNILNTTDYDLSGNGTLVSQDWTGAFQWMENGLAPGETAFFAAALALEGSAQVIPLPAPMLLAGLGLAGAAVGRRRFLAATAA